MSDDYLIFTPDDVDLARSPLRRSLDAPTYTLGAFNPALTRLPNGNLLLMVRVAEALSEPTRDGVARAIRKAGGRYRLDPYPLEEIDLTDPRHFARKGGPYKQLALTSISWLLPVELTPDARAVVAVHYEHAVEPHATYDEYGIEDPRIALIDGTYYMTTCSVSPERHCSTLHISVDGYTWEPQGIVLDHQNKDMVMFEGKVGDRFAALTRPLGESYFAYPDDQPWAGGPAIHLAASPDARHWKPFDQPGIRPRRDSKMALKVGGGTPPVLTDEGWFLLFHGVQTDKTVGIYRTFWALLDRDDPSRPIKIDHADPVIEANPALTDPIKHQMYLPSPVVFSTGIVDGGENWIVASGEADLATRITHIPKSRFRRGEAR